MSRRVAALKPQLNRIRAWAHEGSTDAWIAHQLETTADSVRAFRQEHGIERGGPAPLAPITPDSVVEAMLAEEAAALEAGPEPELPAASVDEADSAPATVRAPRRRARKPPAGDATVTGDAEQHDETAPESPADAANAETEAAPAKPARRRGSRADRATPKAAVAHEDQAAAQPDGDEPGAETQVDAGRAGEDAEAPAGDEPARSARKRGRRRGRGRGARGLEARLLTGSVLLLDPSVTADATFQEHWQGGGPLRVEVGADAIVLRRVAQAEPGGERSERARSA
jgi:peptidoglycan hydrolase-like protein with peptidoglycan-binding domain